MDNTSSIVPSSSLSLSLIRNLNSFDLRINSRTVASFTFDLARAPELATTDLRVALKVLPDTYDSPCRLRVKPDPMLVLRR